MSFRYLMGIILFLAVVAFLYYIHAALQPLIIAAFIAYLINPAVILLTERARLSRAAAVNLVYFTTLALFIITPVLLTPIFFEQLTEVVRDLIAGMETVNRALAQPLEIAGMRFTLEQLGLNPAHIRSIFGAPAPEQAFLLLESTSRGLLWFVVIIVSVYLFLAGWRSMREWLIGLAPAPYRPEVQELYQRVRAIWMSYLRGQILLMFIVGVVFTITWSIMGIPGALVLGVVAGLFTLVPDVGPFLAAVLAMAVALLEGSSWIPFSHFGVTILVLAVYLILINIKNFWLRPYIMGRSVNMHEGLVLVVILIATVLNGILGALLAVPVVASAFIILEYLLKRVAGQRPFQGATIANTHRPQKDGRSPLKKFNRN